MIKDPLKPDFMKTNCQITCLNGRFYPIQGFMKTKSLNTCLGGKLKHRQRLIKTSGQNTCLERALNLSEVS